jgi:competence protein ComEA
MPRGGGVVGEPLRERVRSLERRELISLVVVGALVAAAAAFWYVRSLPGEVSVHLAEDGGSGAGPALIDSPSPAATMLVHVAGWVRHPGVYQFNEGDRVIDAVEAAGGARPGADLASVNLAALLSDAQQVVILKKGATPGSIAGPGTVAGPGGEALVNLNTATLDQLETLPGIGPTLAQRIIDYRMEHGPFRSVDELLEVSGIGDQRLADIRSKVAI